MKASRSPSSTSPGAVEVTPVREIGDHRFTPGELTRTLMEDYDEEVRREVPRTLDAPKAYAA